MKRKNCKDEVLKDTRRGRKRIIGDNTGDNEMEQVEDCKLLVGTSEVKVLHSDGTCSDSSEERSRSLTLSKMFASIIEVRLLGYRVLSIEMILTHIEKHLENFFNKFRKTHFLFCSRYL